MKINREDIESMIGILQHTGESQTSCTFRRYSLTAKVSAKGLVIKWFKKNTREALEATI